MTSARLISAVLPYPEGAASAILRTAAREGMLGTALSPSRAIGRFAAHLAGGDLAQRLRRAHSDDLHLTEVAPHLDAFRLAGIAAGPRTATFGTAVMKRGLDSRASRHFRDSSDAIVVLPGAGAQTMRRAKSALKVLHQVNGTSAAHNEALLEHYGFAAAGELYSPRARRELALDLDLADIVLVPSSVVEEQIAAEGFPRDRIRRVAYGVDFDASAAIAQQRRTNSSPRVLFLGQISYRKGLPTLLKAAEMSGAQVDLVGPVVAPEFLISLPANVHHRPTVSRATLPQLFAQVDALVLPSVEENFGLVVLEAQAAGLPVIISTAVGAADAAVPELTHLVAPGDAYGLARSLADVRALDGEQRSINVQLFRDAIMRGDETNDWATYGQKVLHAIGLLDERCAT